MRVLLDLLVPSSCDGCDRRAPPPWCDHCAALAAPPADPCPRCAGPDSPGHACWAPGSPIDATVTLVRWAGPVATALVRAKEDGRREVHAAAGTALARRLVDVELPGPVGLVVPVPTDRRRVRRRGVDHTVVLARAVACELGLPWRRAVRAAGPLPDRGALPAGGRPPVPSELLRAAAPAAPCTVLVDDVVTTGGTAAAVAERLRDAGARTVVLAALARAGAHPLTGR